MPKRRPSRRCPEEIVIGKPLLQLRDEEVEALGDLIADILIVALGRDRQPDYAEVTEPDVFAIDSVEPCRRPSSV